MAPKKSTQKNRVQLESIAFPTTDFERFRPELQRDPIHNAARLEVRRKLESLGKHLSDLLGSPAAAFESRASLHHPFRFNAYRVSSQWVYLSRAASERKHLKQILGVDLGKDVDQNYVHVLLVMEIHHEGLECAVRIHKDAWWDGENFKRRANSAAGREQLAEFLRKLSGYGLRIHDHRRIHPCETLTAAELSETLKYYTPGEHWLTVFKEFPKDDPFVTEEGLLTRLEQEFQHLLEFYREVRWTPKNNYLFE